LPLTTFVSLNDQSSMIPRSILHSRHCPAFGVSYAPQLNVKL